MSRDGTGPPAADRPATPRRLLTVLVCLGVVLSLGMCYLTAVAVQRTVSSLLPAAFDSGADGDASAGAIDPAGAEHAGTGQASVAIEARLRSMTAALGSGDASAFLANVDPAATPLRASQAKAFATLRRLPLRDVTYSWPGRRFSHPSGQGSQDRASTLVAHVERSYWLAGWDERPAVEPLDLTFVDRGGRWLLSGAGSAAAGAAGTSPGASPDPPPEPWSVADLTAVRSGEALVIGDRSRAALLGTIARRVDDAVTDTRRLWRGMPWNGKAVVYAVTEPRFLRAWFGEHAPNGTDGAGARRIAGPDSQVTAEFDGLVAPVPAATPGSGPAGGAEPGRRWAGTRLLLAPEAMTYPPGRLKTLLRHELTHVATASLDRAGPAPTWMSEGLAEYAAFRTTGGVAAVSALNRRGLPASLWTALRRRSYRPELPVSEQFYDGGQERVGRRYSDAWLAALYVADEHGETALRRLYVASSDPREPDVRRREARALREVLGTDRRGFQRDVSDYARAVRRHFV